MKLYTYDPAPNPRRLALFLKLKGIEIDTQQIDMMTAEQLSEDYRQINPSCSVPALVLDDGTVLTEVIAMYTYLEALHPEPPLMGTTAGERAVVINWCHKLFCGLMMAIASALRNRGKSFVNRALPGPLDTPQIPELVERGLLQIGHILPELLVAIDFLAWIKQAIPEECTHLKDWYQRASAQLA